MLNETPEWLLLLRLTGSETPIGTATAGACLTSCEGNAGPGRHAAAAGKREGRRASAAFTGKALRDGTIDGSRTEAADNMGLSVTVVGKGHWGLAATGASWGTNAGLGAAPELNPTSFCAIG